ncbi:MULTISPECIES: cation:proton antiporter family protein [Mycobacteriaceae]|uniref:Potassium transporter Kef n=1 Tax=Mycolicibacterium neoaurum VKM Ac-1815D TaxID=700508 RepID=V5X7B9_MYCNE|nr:MULTISPECIES: cation:proton antiporter family protein [Mycobacteriaceae]AXK77687.1 potassium transporter Kef [Mycolicibacterium neoaurum]MDO3401122.1 cation:proton antiporter [Mycolicibacterium neoaurum]WBP94609.1 cation:proton antiporter [Mycolicibacterium neoaurum]WBS08308.1 cation:proton antiporter [Mycolicibacterium neoaurum]
MTTVAIYLVVTFGLGGLAMAFRLPPLVGFLAAGFVINALDVEHIPQLEILADLGVTLLLFAIGLKLDVRILLRREVWLTTSVHMLISVVFGGAALWLAAVAGMSMLTGQSLQTIALLAFALSFSSTVFVVKVLEERGESHALYGRVAIGILVMQDIVAVVFLTATSGHLPSPWALALVGLWPLTRVLRKIWTRLGHGEMQSLFGIVMAFVPGYALFSAVGLKGDLGALIIGVLLASHSASSELARSLFHIKELLLVGFFVSIGLTGLPDLPTIGVAMLMVLLLPFKAGWYVALLSLMRLRHRTSLLAGLSLMNYSEFGLIVVSVGVSAGMLAPAWLVEMSIAVALSFVVSALVNGRGHLMVEKIAARLPAQDEQKLQPEERPVDAGDAEVVVIGMGRVGFAAYQRLTDHYGLRVVGVDYDGRRIQRLAEDGLRVVEGDATDLDFWHRLRHSESARIAILAMPRHGANVTALDCLRESGFSGTVAAVARYDDEVAWAKEQGVEIAFNVYAGAGLELADQVGGGPVPATVDPDLDPEPEAVEDPNPR